MMRESACAYRLAAGHARLARGGCRHICGHGRHALEALLQCLIVLAGIAPGSFQPGVVVGRHRVRHLASACAGDRRDGVPALAAGYRRSVAQRLALRLADAAGGGRRPWRLAAGTCHRVRTVACLVARLARRRRPVSAGRLATSTTAGTTHRRPAWTLQSAGAGTGRCLSSQ